MALFPFGFLGLMPSFGSDCWLLATSQLPIVYRPLGLVSNHTQLAKQIRVASYLLRWPATASRTNRAPSLIVLWSSDSLDASISVMSRPRTKELAVKSLAA